MQAKYSPVGNVKLMLELCKAHLLDNYILLLAHHVVEFPEEHRQLMEMLNSGVYRANARDLIVILDNSLIELGNAVDLNMMQEAAKIVRPTFVVLPDVLLDWHGSVNAFKDAYIPWQEVLKAACGPCSFLPVVQGNDHNEMIQCAHEYMEYSRAHGELIGALGIPRKFASETGTRMIITDALIKFHRLPIHLMGFSSHLSDDLKTAALNGVMGIDSATPLRLGFEGMQVDLKFGENLEKQVFTAREVFFNEALEVTSDMSYNIAYIKGAINGLQQR